MFSFFLVFNLLIGAKTEVGNCVLSKKSEYSFFCHSHFIKNEKERAGLFEGLYHGIFVEVGLHFPAFKLQTRAMSFNPVTSHFTHACERSMRGGSVV